MFDIGFSELILVFIVALVVLGPEKMPLAINSCVKWIRSFKKVIHTIQTEINKEIGDVKDIINPKDYIDQETLNKFRELEQEVDHGLSFDEEKEIEQLHHEDEHEYEEAVMEKINTINTENNINNKNNL